MMRSFLMILAIAAAALAARAEFVNIPPTRLHPDSALMIRQPHGSQFWVEARAEVSGNKSSAGRSKHRWGLEWRDSLDLCGAYISWGNTDFGSDFDRRYARVELCRADSVIASVALYDDIDLHNGPNTLALSYDHGYLAILAGSRALRWLEGLDRHPFPAPDSIKVVTDTPLRVIGGHFSSRSPQLTITGWNVEALRERFAASSDPNEGFWEYLDRENDPTTALPATRYTLATVKNPDNSYSIIYLGGDPPLDGDGWLPGMLKGTLTPTIFIGQFRATWVDAEGQPLDAADELTASITDGAILAMRFPLLDTTLRFSKASRM